MQVQGCGLSTDMREYVRIITGMEAAELSALNPEDEIALARKANGSEPRWPHRGFKTFRSADSHLNKLVLSGARQY